MLRRMFLAAFVLILPTTLVSSSAAVRNAVETSPALMIRVRPLEHIMDHAKFLAKKFGEDGDPKEIEAKLLEKIGLDNLAESGIDMKKPLGAYATVAANVADSTFVAMLPVADDKALLAYLGKHEIKADKVEDNFFSLALPNMELPLFVRFAQGYAYVTAMHKEAVAIDKLLTPNQVFGGNETATVAATLYPERIPEAARKTALDWIVEQVKEHNDDDDEIVKAQLGIYQKWTEMLAQDGKEATLRINFDQASGELTFDVQATPKPGTKLATEIAAIKPTQSLFTKMVGAEGAINVLSSSLLDAEMTKLAVKKLQDADDDLLETFNIHVDDEKSKDEIRKVVRALVPSVEGGNIDMAMTLRPGAKNYTALVGARLKEGKKIEELVKKAVESLPKDERDKVKLDAHKVAGQSIHSIQTEDDDNVKKVLGDLTIHFGFRDDAVVFGVGENSVKAVADALAALSLQPAPTVQLDVTAGKLKQMCDAFDESVFPMVQGIFGTDDRLRIYRLTMEGGATLKGNATVSLQAMVGAFVKVAGMFGG